MSQTTKEIIDLIETWKLEDEKFSNGNNAAGTRARKALHELGKLTKVRRSEITEEKNSRKESKES